MAPFLLLLSLVVAANAASFEGLIDQEWQLFKAQYGKSYSTPVEDLKRMRIFLENKYYIIEHNLRYRAGEENFEMGINQFSDMLPEEVDEIYNGFNKENRLLAKEGEDPFLPELDGEEFVPPSNMEVPETLNWIEKGAVTPVRSQGRCGSCYAFAAMGALEGHHYLKTKNLTVLSTQNIVDCSCSHGNKGCNGGLALYSFRYVMENGGVNDEATYPYEAKQGKCRYNPKKIAAKCSRYVQLAKGDEEMLKKAVAIGPVSVSIDASLKSFHMYKSGVYNDTACSSTKLCHAVLVVGYGKDKTSNLDFWLVKNSWDTTWGDKGYIKMARNANNMCGIASRPIYPIVDSL